MSAKHATMCAKDATMSAKGATMYAKDATMYAKVRQGRDHVREVCAKIPRLCFISVKSTNDRFYCDKIPQT